MAKKWTMVRIETETWERLFELKKLFEAQCLKGNMPELEQHDRFGVPLSEVIRVLIDRDEKHRKRAREQQAKRRKPKPDGE